MTSKAFALLIESAPVALLIACTGIFLGCNGMNSDPLNEHSSLIERGVPAEEYKPQIEPLEVIPTPGQADPQVVAAGEVFPPPSTGGQVFNFVQGQRTSYFFEMPIRLSGIEYEIRGENLPEGFGFRHVAGVQYEIAWIPQNILAAGEDSKSFQIKFRLSATRIENESVANIYNSAIKEREVTIHLQQNAEQGEE